MRILMNIFIVLVLLLAGVQMADAVPACADEPAASPMILDTVSPDDEGCLRFIAFSGIDKALMMVCDVSHVVTYISDACPRIHRARMQDMNFHMRLLLFYCSLREVGLLGGKQRLFPSTIFHCVIPSCEYFVFALRKIII